jgi:signal transduction histidine kinase
VSLGADIGSIRRSLGLTTEDEQLVRTSASEFAAEVPGWVDAFYARQVTDPVAMAILSSEARVLRLKRTFTAWFHELFVLPFDAAYERTREEIGRVHLRIGMPLHLMVTAMGGVRADVRATVHRRLAGDPARAERLARALDKVLDLELCLMLSAYWRAARQSALRRDRELLVRRLGERLASSLRGARDAAACYAELLRGASELRDRERWAARLASALERIARSEAGGATALSALEDPLERTRLAPLVAQAVREVDPQPGRVEVHVDPQDLEVAGHADLLCRAVGELVRDALVVAPGPVRIACTREAAGVVVLEVRDPSATWLGGLRATAAVLALPPDLGAALAEHVAALHGGGVELADARTGGTGVRLRLPATPVA